MVIGQVGSAAGLNGALSGSSAGSVAGGGGLGGALTQLATVAQNAGGSSGSSGSSMLSAVGSGAAMGATLGSVLPGVGTAIGAGAGALIGAIGSLLNGSGGVPDHERGDLNTIATTYDITADQASTVCGFEESHSPRNYDDICAQAARDGSFWTQILNKYNAAHPNGQIRTRTEVAVEQAAPQYLQLQTQLANSFAGTKVASPLANLSFPAAQAAAKQQNMSLQDYLTAIVNGALAGLQKGASDAVAETPAAQELKKSVIKDWVKENQLIVAGAGVGLAWLISQAVQNNRK